MARFNTLSIFNTIDMRSIAANQNAKCFPFHRYALSARLSKAFR